MVLIQILHLCAPMLYLHTQMDSDWITIALTFNNDHIIYNHMDATWSLAGLKPIFLILTI